MKFGLNICVRCRSVIYQLLKHSPRRSLTSSCDKFDNSRPGGESVLHKDVQEMHEHLKAFFPYSTPWRLNARAIDKLNSAKPGSRKRLFLALSVDEDKKIKEATKNARRKEEYQRYLETRTATKQLFETPLLWTQNKTMHLWENNELRHTYMFGPEIVIDCGFECDFSDKPRLQRYYLDCFIKLNQYNNTTPHRTKIVLCNLPEDSKLRALINQGPPSIRHQCFLSMRSESYLDLYDRKKLVYLTPDAKQTMDEFDPRVTYIIGGLPDRAGELKKASFAKARKEGLMMLKLPTQKYFKMKPGSSIVPLHRMLMLLAHARETSLVEGMLQFIPSRNKLDLTELRRVSTLSWEKQQKAIAEIVNRRGS